MQFLNQTGESPSGTGIAVDSSANYVAQNTSCNNDINYQYVDGAYVSSQANARGVANVDCSLTTSDEVTQIKQETWSIESKAEIISSKIDFIDRNIFSKLDLIDTMVESKLDRLDREYWSIESKAEIISSKVDMLVKESTCDSEVKIFEFTGYSLDQKATTSAPDGTVLSIAWLVDETTRYLATGGVSAAAPNNNEIKVFEFTGSSLIQRARTTDANSRVAVRGSNLKTMSS